MYATYKINTYLEDPGKARGWSTNIVVIDEISDSASPPFPLMALQSCHAQTVWNRLGGTGIAYS